MGPNDPFATLHTAAHVNQEMPEAFPERPAAARFALVPGPPVPRVVGLGFFMGLLFGTLVQFSGWSSALLIFGFGIAGGLLGWMIYGVFSGRLDFRAAWNALQRTT